MKMKYLFVPALALLMSPFAFAQSAAGKWSGEMPGGRGGGTTPVAFEFTVSGTTLTGTITVGQGMATPITGGTIMGDTITFQAPAGGGGRGGGGGGRGGGGGGAPGGGAPPAGGPPPAAGGGGGGGGGQGGGGGRGGGLATYTGKVSAGEIAFSRTGGGGGGRGGGGGAPGGGAPPAGGAAPAAPAPVTFTVKKAS